MEGINSQAVALRCIIIKQFQDKEAIWKEHENSNLSCTSECHTRSLLELIDPVPNGTKAQINPQEIWEGSNVGPALKLGAKAGAQVLGVALTLAPSSVLSLKSQRSLPQLLSWEDLCSRSCDCVSPRTSACRLVPGNKFRTGENGSLGLTQDMLADQ